MPAINVPTVALHRANLKLEVAVWWSRENTDKERVAMIVGHYLGNRNSPDTGVASSLEDYVVGGYKAVLGGSDCKGRRAMLTQRTYRVTARVLS